LSLRITRPRIWSAATRPLTVALNAVTLQIIWLLSQGRSAKFAAEVTGYTPTWVSQGNRVKPVKSRVLKNRWQPWGLTGATN